LEPKESVWGLVSHFLYDITHFDGKFFSTLGYLVRKPGFLSKEYIRGRRASYLNPIRMYVFSSALFFIIFFSMFNVRSWNLGYEDKRDKADTLFLNEKDMQASLQGAKNLVDSIRIIAYYEAIKGATEPNMRDIMDSLKKDKGQDDNDLDLGFKNSGFKTLAEYDSAQKSKPLRERDGWLARKINQRFIELNKKYENNGKQFLKDLLDKFIHSFPYLLFVSLPLYALFLKLLYIRRKHFYYVDHGIFLVHLYIFTFIVLLILFGFYKLSEITDWGWIGWVQAVLMIYGVIYTLKAMRNFYNQGWTKTVIKFILLNFLAFISLIFLFSLFFILTVFRI
jgi:hypothetical protein